jgi:hypothetical protein
MSDDSQGGMFGSKARSKSGSNAGGRGSTKEYPQWDDSALQYVLDAIEYDEGPHTRGEWIIGVRDENSEEIPEGAREHYDLDDDMTHISVESLGPIDVSDVQGIGTAVKVTYEQLQASVEAGVIDEDTLADMDIEPGDTVSWRPSFVESTPQSDLGMCLNGHHAEEIVERFGDDCKVRVRTAPMAWAEAAHERYTNVSFYVSNAKKAAFSRENARATVGAITQSELEEWARETGNEGYLD